MAEPRGTPSLASLARTKVLTPERAVAANQRMFENWQRFVGTWSGSFSNPQWIAGYSAGMQDARGVFVTGAFPQTPVTKSIVSWPFVPASDYVYPQLPVLHPDLNPILIYARGSFKQDSIRETRTRLARVRPGSFDGVEL